MNKKELLDSKLKKHKFIEIKHKKLQKSELKKKHRKLQKSELKEEEL